MRAFDRLRKLTRYERGLTVQAAVAIGAASAALRLVGLKPTLRLVHRTSRVRTEIVIGDVVTAIDRAGRYVPGATCLPKSLALAWMLRGKGVAAAVRIGVKPAGRFEAHAWVESGGVALNDPERPAERYAAFDSL